MTMTQEEINEIRAFTGEDTLMTIKKTPFIQFDAETGIFSKVDGKGEDGKNILIPIGKELTGVIIRVRKQIASSKSSLLKVYSNEFSSYNDVIEIFDKGANQSIACATYSQLQEKYGKEVIKLSEIVYIFFEEKLWRMSVKGTSLNPLWDYLRSFGENDTVIRYKSHLTSIDDKNEFGEFKVLKFTKGELVANFEQLWSDLKKLDGTFSPSQRQQKKLDKIAETPALSAGSDIPTIDYDEEEKKAQEAVDTIPF